MSSKKDPESLSEDRSQTLEEQIKNLSASYQALRTEVSELRQALKTVEDQADEASDRYVVTCPSCSTLYDMLAHHYSIGLFDNMVYVKCPKCSKTMPIHGGAGGAMGAVSDETA